MDMLCILPGRPVTQPWVKENESRTNKCRWTREREGEREGGTGKIWKQTKESCLKSPRRWRREMKKEKQERQEWVESHPCCLWMISTRGRGVTWSNATSAPRCNRHAASGRCLAKQTLFVDFKRGTQRKHRSDPRITTWAYIFFLRKKDNKKARARWVCVGLFRSSGSAGDSASQVCSMRVCREGIKT